MSEKISNIFDYGDGIAVIEEQVDWLDTARIKELTMNKIKNETYEAHEKKTRPVYRTILLAAVIAALLIGGAMAVYHYSLQDAAIEGVPTTDSKLYDWKAGETETRLSLNGFSDSPEYQAYVEWTEWNSAWKDGHPDPYKTLGVDDSYYETPVNYLLYEAVFTEQGEKLDEIAAKYGLTLLSKRHDFRSEARLCRALDTDNLIADSCEIYGGYFFDNGTFLAFGHTAVNGESVDFSVWNAVKGSFVPYSSRIPEDYTEWYYTTRDGIEIIMMTDPLRETTELIAPLNGCYVTAEIQTDDPQAAQAFADALELAALNGLFAADSARAAAAQSITSYLEALPAATTVEELSKEEQAVLDYLGDWYLTELPADTLLCQMSVSLPDHFEDFYSVRRSYDGGGLTGSLFYRELDPLDGENDEARQRLSTYSGDYLPSDWSRTPCTVSGCEAILARWNNSTYYELCWLDTDRQLLFTLSMGGVEAEEMMALAEAVSGTAPETVPQRSASTPEERFLNSLQPLSRVSFTCIDETKNALAELGNYGLTGLPDGTGAPLLLASQDSMYEHYWDGSADWTALCKIYSSDPELGADSLSLEYRRFDDGRTAEAYEIDKQYDSSYADITELTVGECSGYITGGDYYGGQTLLTWYSEAEDLIFTLSVSASQLGNMTGDDILALAESVTEQPWDGTESIVYEQPDTEHILSELGCYELPGEEYGSIVEVSEEQIEDWAQAPFWYVEDAPYMSKSAAATYAGGLTLRWLRTETDTARETTADSFAAITDYLLACDDSGAVQTGLSVNGQNAICVSFPAEELWNEAHTDIIWYDAEAELIFFLSEYPGEDGTTPTAAQLITLAESVSAQ